ncbi:high-affinity choline transporter 1-like [Gigantopelta aegis]|uniref:high-affinity choline transporter 1-like n=1 Tax=Gigantopelta aegis TaxID=1735272 RepID=UPI001B889CB4|nr:high-affinity choline transporter 1-like [Gigantopelta aegis]
MSVHIAGIAAIVVFYLIILGVGLWAARKAKQTGSTASSEDVMLAGRNIGAVIGIFTMTATWVGGAYINGTAEMIVRSGLIWCQAPFGYALSLVFERFTGEILKWVSIPFAFTHEAVSPITVNATENWIGTLETDAVGTYIDTYLLLIFGGIPWQVYFQRVLSSKSALKAQVLSFIAAFGCIIMALPAVLLGAIAASTDWNQTDWDGKVPLPGDTLNLILPMCLQYLCPSAVSFLGLGAVSAAVMSSADSSILSASSMFSHNIYKCIFRQQSSEKEILWVMRVAIFGVGVMATAMAITVTSIYELWYLCADLVYVVLFPQLISVLFVQSSNTYGSLAGYITGLFFRLGGGEPAMGVDPFIFYPFYDYENNLQLFPFKTFSMLCSLATIAAVSYPLKYSFETGIFPRRFDVFMCIVNIPEESIALATRDNVNDVAEVPKYSEANGKINPALKFSQDDLCDDDDISPDSVHLTTDKMDKESTDY